MRYCGCLTLLAFVGVLSGEELTVLQLVERDEPAITHIDISRSGNFLASSDSAGGVTVWDTSNWKQIHSFTLKKGRATSVRFSQSSDKVAISATSGDTIVWEVESGKKTLTIPQEQSQGQVRWLNDDKLLLTASNEFDLRADAKIWRSDTGKHELDLDVRTRTRDSLFLPGKGLIAATSISRTVDLFDIRNGTRVGVLGKFGVAPLDIPASHDQKEVMILTDESIQQWDLETRKPIKEISRVELDLEGIGERHFQSLAWNSEHQLLAYGQCNGVLTVVDLKRRRKVAINMPGSLVSEIAISKSGDYLVTCGWEYQPKDGKSYLYVIGIKHAFSSFK